MFGQTVAGITGSNAGSLSQLGFPTAVRVDTSGVQFILDWTNCRVMKWIEGEPMGSVIAGITSSAGSSQTLLSSPYNIYFDGYQNLFVLLIRPIIDFKLRVHLNRRE